MNLFQRDPESLNDFIPRFSREEVLLGYKVTQVQIGGGFKWMGDPEDIMFEDRSSITILGQKFEGEGQYFLTAFEIVVEIVNAFFANAVNKRNYPEQWKFLTENAHELNISRHYWIAMDHLAEIEKIENKIYEMKEQVRKAKYIASMMAVEVKSGRSLSREERQLLIVEFSGESK